MVFGGFHMARQWEVANTYSRGVTCVCIYAKYSQAVIFQTQQHLDNAC